MIPASDYRDTGYHISYFVEKRALYIDVVLTDSGKQKGADTVYNQAKSCH